MNPFRTDLVLWSGAGFTRARLLGSVQGCDDTRGQPTRPLKGTSGRQLPCAGVYGRPCFDLFRLEPRQMTNAPDATVGDYRRMLRGRVCSMRAIYWHRTELSSLSNEMRLGKDSRSARTT